jgi:hypothetical protein
MAANTPPRFLIRKKPALKPAIKNEPLKGWWIWDLGRPNPRNNGRQPKYLVTIMYLPQKMGIEDAVREAKRLFPDKVGHLLIED